MLQFKISQWLKKKLINISQIQAENSVSLRAGWVRTIMIRVLESVNWNINLAIKFLTIPPSPLWAVELIRKSRVIVSVIVSVMIHEGHDYINKTGSFLCATLDHQLSFIFTALAHSCKCFGFLTCDVVMVGSITDWHTWGWRTLISQLSRMCLYVYCTPGLTQKPHKNRFFWHIPQAQDWQRVSSNPADSHVFNTLSETLLQSWSKLSLTDLKLNLP